MSLHQDFLAKLQGLAQVSLVASLRDDVLGFAARDELRVFLSDFHLVSEAAADRYSYATNHLALLAEVVHAIESLKQEVAGEVLLYHLGDLLDVWREGPRDTVNVDYATRIVDDHVDLAAPFIDDRPGTFSLFGNHDFELFRWADYSWDRRLFLPASGHGPSAIALHGDVFDWVERLPNWLNRLVVYYFSPHHSPSTYHSGEIMRLVEQDHAGRDYHHSIHGTGLAASSLLDPGQVPVPTSYHVQHAGNHVADGLEFLGGARTLCQKAGADYGLDLRVAIVGHTHQPRIAVEHDAEGKIEFVLIDTGGWIESLELPDGRTVPNAQVTAICDNEVRIYQLAPA